MPLAGFNGFAVSHSTIELRGLLKPGTEPGGNDARFLHWCGAGNVCVQNFYSKVSLVYFVIATTVLMVLAFFLLGTALWELWQIIEGSDPASTALSSISLLIIGFAVIETAKFIAEEEVLRTRELRSSRESRRSITKFITIIVIAASLEALVMVFQATREGIQFAIYPASLFLAATASLVALGVYQWLSSRIGDDRPGNEGE